MSWRRSLRVGVALLGIAFAVVLFVSKRARPVTDEPVSPAMPTDPEALSESAGGRLDHFHGGPLEFTIDHKGQRTYADGRSEFLSAHVHFTDNGREIWADRMEITRPELNAVLGTIRMAGHVRLTQGDALRVEADEATYDDSTGHLDIPGRVTFAKGAMSGGGIGASYDRETDRFAILAEATATIAPTEAGSEPLALTSDRMELASVQNYLQMDGQARIVKAGETLAGDNATLTFADAGAQIKFLELRGHASVTPAPDAGNVPGMRADAITMAFQAEGGSLEHATLTGGASMRLRDTRGEKSVSASWLDLYLGPDGRTITRLDGRDRVIVSLPASADTPAREIRSSTLAARGTPSAGLQTATFEGDVSFVEQTARQATAERRSGQSTRLILGLDGGLDSIREADFREQVVFETGTTKAEADRGRYRAAEGRLLLERTGSGQARQPRVERKDGSLAVDADTIDLATDSEDLVATGRVASVSRATPGGSGSGSGMFDSDKPVYGSGAKLVYAAATGTATYDGVAGNPARVIQGENRVAAARVAIEERSNNLRADGAVESVFVEAPDAAGGEPKTSEVNADTLVYEDAGRRATYSGHVQFRNADGETEADQLALQLSETRSVTSFDATGASVFAQLTGGHEARGDRLRYDSATGAYTLIGRPALAKSPNESGGGCVLTKGVQATLTPGRGARWQSFGTGPVETQTVKCEVSIR